MQNFQPLDYNSHPIALLRRIEKYDNSFSTHLQQAYVSLRKSDLHPTHRYRNILTACVEPACLVSLEVFKTRRAYGLFGPTITHLEEKFEPNSPIFAKLNKHIGDLLTIINDNTNEPANASIAAFIDELKWLVKYYQDYQLAVINNTGEQRAQLLLAPASFSTSEIPYQKISSDLARKIIRRDAKGDFQVPSDSNVNDDADAIPKNVGSHPVYHYQGLYFKILVHSAGEQIMTEQCDEPGMAYAIQQLFCLLFPEQTTTPQTELILLREPGNEPTKPGKAYPIQLSTRAGIANLQECFTDPQKQSYLSKIDPLNFCIHVILSLLTRLGDAKIDNFTYEVTERNNQVDSIHLFNVDCDDAFVSPFCFFMEKNGPQPNDRVKRHALNLKNILFCLPDMQQKIVPALREHLLSTASEQLVLQWLYLLELQNQHYELLQKDGIYTSAMMTGMRLPLKLQTEAILQMHHRFRKLKQALQNPDVTLWNIFEALEPALAICYQALLSRKPKGQSLLDYFYTKIYKNSTIENILDILTSPNRKIVEEALTKVTNSEVSHDVRTDTILEVSIALLREMETSAELNESQEVQLYHTQLYYTQLQHPVFAHCNTLTDQKLKQFLSQRNNAFQTTVCSVTIYDCPLLTQKGLKNIINMFPAVRFAIGACPAIDIMAWFNNEDFPEEAQIFQIYKGGRRCALSLANYEIAFQAATEGDVKLIELLHKKFTSALSFTDENMNTPLHFACEHGNLSTVLFLLTNQSTLLRRCNKNDSSALDALINSRQVIPIDVKQQIILSLINHSRGHILCKQAALVLELLTAPGTDLVSRITGQEYLTNFALQNRVFANAALLSTLPANTTHIDLSHSDIQDTQLDALVAQCPTLTSMNIGYCASITKLGLSKALAKLTTKITVDLTYEQALQFGLIQLDHLDAPLLIDSLPFHPRLSEFTVPFTQRKTFNGNHVQTLAQGLQHHPALNKLILVRIRLDQQNCKALINALIAHPGVTEIDLSETHLTDHAIPLLSKLIASNPRIKRLSLRKNQFSARGLTSLVTVLQNNPSLEHLDLYGSTFDDLSIKALTDALLRNKRLKTLVLNECSISEYGIGLCAHLLTGQAKRREGITLQDIDLGYNHMQHDISTAGHPLYEVLKKLKDSNALGQLQFIRFGGNKIADMKLVNQLKLLGIVLFINQDIDQNFTKPIADEILSYPRTLDKLPPNPELVREISHIDTKHTQRLKDIKELVAQFQRLYTNARAKNPSKLQIYDQWNQTYMNLYQPILDGKSTVDTLLDRWIIEKDQQLAIAAIQAHQQLDLKLHKQIRGLNEQILAIKGEKMIDINTGAETHFHVSTLKRDKLQLIFGSNENTERVLAMDDAAKTVYLNQIHSELNAVKAQREASIAHGAFAEIIVKCTEDALRIHTLTPVLYGHQKRTLYMAGTKSSTNIANTAATSNSSTSSTSSNTNESADTSTLATSSSTVVTTTTIAADSSAPNRATNSTNTETSSSTNSTLHSTPKMHS